MALNEEDEDLPNLSEVDFGLTDEERGLTPPKADGRPPMDSPEWSPWVVSQFEGDEIEDNVVFIHGLRRVLRKVLGPVLRSTSRVVQAPRFVPDEAHLTPTVVEHTLVIRPNKEPSFYEGDLYEVTAVADVIHLPTPGFAGSLPGAFGNTNFKFSQHPDATAATKAESIAHKKALILGKGVLTFEEKSTVPTEEQLEKGFMSENDKNVLDLVCSRAKVNVLKLIGSTVGKYKNIDHVPYAVGHKLNKLANDYNRGAASVPESLKGYDPDWKKKQR